MEDNHESNASTENTEQNSEWDKIAELSKAFKEKQEAEAPTAATKRYKEALEHERAFDRRMAKIKAEGEPKRI